MKRIKRVKLAKKRKEKGKRHFSLRFKLSVVLICGLLLAGSFFVSTYMIGNFIVWRHFSSMTEADARAINQDYVQDLQKFININRLSIKQVDRISDWKIGKHVELVFYQDRDLIYFDSETGDGKNFEDFLSEDDKKKHEETLKNILDGNVDAYPVSFTDGTLLVTVVDESEDFWSNFVLVSSIVFSVIILMSVMIIYFSYITKRIRALAFTVQKVEAGNMDLTIEDRGHDEIGKLAGNVNSMRNAVVENMSKEREAWEANAGLITAMSHDIRTPLTVMLGYLELMELQNSDPDNEEYIDACRQNALKLKKLSDDMFSYFLVFGKREVSLDMTEVDADSAIPHMLEEHCALLSERGYNIRRSFKIKGAKVKIDTVYFNRVIDNVFSNIGKYANSEWTVDVSMRIRKDKLVIIIENRILEDTSGAESNGIGLKTCTKIMEQLGGSFESFIEKDKFISRIELPIIKEANVSGEGV